MQQPDAGIGAVVVPQLPSAEACTYPWRCPAHLSVCMRPSPSSDVQPHLGGRTCPSDASSLSANGQALQMHSPALPSGTRSPEQSVNAENWFENSNRNMCGPQNVSFVDRGSPIRPQRTYNNTDIEDPPFYLQQRESSSDNDNACAAPSVPSHHRSHNLVHHTLPENSPRSRLDMSESNSEDYRSVIDDLTVQNKQLKQRLKMYEKLHGSNLQRDKLFEVRVYGLSANRKRELEAILQSFAAIDEELEKPLPLSSSLGTYPSLNSTATDLKPWSSSTSCSRPVDSAYASMSASGQPSGSLSQDESSRKSERRRQFVEAKEQNIHSYLQDIPEGILPRRLPDMTEKAKKELVVRRLEQLFTGTGASTGLHSQSLQQQEVSQSAANADRTATEARGCKSSADGVREARILPTNTEYPAEFANDTTFSSHGQYLEEPEGLKPGGTNTSNDRTPDQRPTRLLDLDPYRAQVPAENVRYIRHLCIASSLRCVPLPLEDMQDWVYLNLLTSMAQLHTINVTLEFVRMAVDEVSTKLELSRDGGKIRWRGGTEGTRLSSDSSGSWSSPDSEDGNENEVYPRFKRRKLAENPPPVHYGANSLRKPRQLGHTSITSSFGYEPMSFRRTHHEEAPKDHVHDSDSIRSVEFFEGLAAMGNNLDAGVVLDLRKGREEGPIIYYDGAPFCTDLSGDSNFARYHDTEVSASGADVLGCLPFADMRSDLCPEGSPTDVNQSPESVWMGRRDMDTMEFMAGFEEIGSSPNANSSTPSRLEASGIGGVQPCDNFCVNVLVRHAITKVADSLTVSRFSSFRDQVHRITHQSPQWATDAFDRGLLPSPTVGCQRAVRIEVVSAETVHLPPSTLPPPSHVFHPFSSSDSDDEDCCERDSADEASSNPASLAALHRSSTVSAQQCYLAWSSSETDDSSIDLLAHAREQDPDTVAAQEREFEDNIGQQVAKDIGRACSTATIGVESRFSGAPSSPSNRPVGGNRRQKLERRKKGRGRGNWAGERRVRRRQRWSNWPVQRVQGDTGLGHGCQ